jgi:predicted metal-dependent hydrolase
MSETLHIAELEFEVRRGPRRKTLGLTVDRAGELVVHAPLTASDDELRKWVNRKLLWVHQKLAQKEELNSTIRSPEFVSGESFFYLGKSYRLRVVNKGEVPLSFDGERYLLRRTDLGDAAFHFRQWYLKTGTPWLTQRAATWESRVNVIPSRVKVSDLGFRWGSCGKDNVVHFNWRVLQLPVRLIDYVVVHELVHLLEHNHSREFWRNLDRVMPDWRQRKGRIESEWHSFAVFGMNPPSEKPI